MQSLLKPDLDLDYLRAFVSRLESVLEITSDSSLSRTLKNELNSLREVLKV